MAIDKYIELCAEEQPSGKEEKVDPRLQRIIENIFARCISEGEYKQVWLVGSFHENSSLINFFLI